MGFTAEAQKYAKGAQSPDRYLSASYALFASLR